MANRVGKYKISERESALNLTDGGTIQGNITIGASATDTVGFFGSTPVVRPIVSSSVVVGGGIDNLVLDFASGVSGSQFNELITQLTNIGIISSSLG